MTPKEQAIQAAELADWRKVVLNGGPPCFHLEEDGTFCLRAKQWDGHDDLHRYVSLASLLRDVAGISLLARGLKTSPETQKEPTPPE